VHRRGFPREQGFIDRQAGRFAQHGIGRHALALRHCDDIAGHQVAGRDHAGLAITPHPHLGRGQFAQGIECTRAAMLLPNHQDHTEHRKGRQQQAFAQITQDQIEAGCDQQQQEHRLGQHGPHHLQPTPSLVLREQVEPHTGLARARLLGAQTPDENRRGGLRVHRPMIGTCLRGSETMSA